MTENSSSTKKTSTPMDVTFGLLCVAHAACLILLVVMTRSAFGVNNVTEALAFYGVYHREPINQLIHFFGVPAIIWSMFLFMSHVPIISSSHFKLHLPWIPLHSVTYATIFALWYAIFYLKVDPFGGTLYLPLLYAMYASAVRITCNDQSINNKSSSWMGTKKPLKVALVVQILSWYVQIHPGHGMYEGAAPAVTQSIGGAMTSAPLFAFYEGLWLLGIHTELQQKTIELVNLYTKQLCEGGIVSMRACANI